MWEASFHLTFGFDWNYHRVFVKTLLGVRASDGTDASHWSVITDPCFRPAAPILSMVKAKGIIWGTFRHVPNSSGSDSDTVGRYRRCWVVSWLPQSILMCIKGHGSSKLRSSSDAFEHHQNFSSASLVPQFYDHLFGCV
jgi:hypothetical protein